MRRASVVTVALALAGVGTFIAIRRAVAAPPDRRDVVAEEMRRKMQASPPSGTVHVYREGEGGPLTR
jgi:hypothetical protein